MEIIRGKSILEFTAHNVNYPHNLGRASGRLCQCAELGIGREEGGDDAMAVRAGIGESVASGLVRLKVLSTRLLSDERNLLETSI